MSFGFSGFDFNRLTIESTVAIKRKGTSGDDVFDIAEAGDVHIRGRGGDDTVIAGGNFTEKDRFNGGEATTSSTSAAALTSRV